MAGAACPQSQRASARPWVNLCGISAYHLRCRPGVDCEPPGNAVDPLRLKRLTGAAARRPRPASVRNRDRAEQSRWQSMRFVHRDGGVERDWEVRLGRPDAVVADLAAALCA